MSSIKSDRAVRVLFFSVLRETLGCRSLEMNLDDPVSADDLLDDLAATYPALKPFRASVRMAVNESYVEGDHIVRAGDEVALITPVSGG